MTTNPLRRVITGIVVFAAVCFVASMGYVREGWSVGDAFYMTVITIFGVGYGEVKPVETTSLRTLTILVIIFGYSAAIYTVGGFIQILIDGELQHAFRSRKMSQGIASLRNHTILVRIRTHGNDHGCGAQRNASNRSSSSMRANPESPRRTKTACSPWSATPLKSIR